MRRWFYLSLATMMCLTACGNPTSNSTETNSTENTQETTTEAETEVAEFDGPVIPEAWLNGTFSEEKVIANCGNFDIKIYPFTMTRNISFLVFSEEKLPEGVEVTIDTDAKYEFFVSELDMVNGSSYSMVEQNFTYDLYSCYQGRDWTQLYEAEEKKNIAKENFEKALEEAKITDNDLFKAKTKEEEAQKLGLTKEDVERLVALQEKWYEMNQQNRKLTSFYMEHYREFLEERKEKEVGFYSYIVTINFPSPQPNDEVQLEGMRTIEQVTLQAGDWSTEIQIGNIEVYYDSIELPLYKGIDFKMGGKLQSSYPLYATETEFHDDIMTFIATENITITDFYLYEEEDFAIEKARIDIQTDGGTQSVQWGPGREILIRKGETFSIDVVISNENYMTEQYAYKIYPIVQYQVGDETSHVVGEIVKNTTGQSTLWESYAELVHGVDVKSYYMEYANKMCDVEAEWEENQ